MCGIAGVFHYRGGRADPATVRRQIARLEHRGPEAGGVWSDGPAALGHRRLALVDLSASANPPLSNEDGSVWLTFNGELYGWDSLARQMRARGHRFRTSGDAELVLHLYEEHGAEAVELLRGEFAFALYDMGRHRLLLARDRLGVKPLYFHDDGTRIAFASELDALLEDPSVPRELDERALVEYLALRYVAAPRTIWKGVRMLEPAHRLTCDPFATRLSRYWELPAESEAPPAGADPRAELRARLAESVRLYQTADVPVGVLLSGGIDSSAVAALMASQSAQKVCTFSVGFDASSHSELQHAREVAQHLGTEHHERVLEASDVEELPRLAADSGEPLGDPSLLPTLAVSRLARTRVKAVLSGDGGDELFGGYTTYAAALRHARLRWIPAGARRWLGSVGRGLDSRSSLRHRLERVPLDVLERHLVAMTSFSRPRLRSLLAPDLGQAVARCDRFDSWRASHARAAARLGDVPALLWLDTVTYLPGDILRKVDNASMRCSLEVRAPLLDHELVEFAAALPFRFKHRDGVGKWILRDSVSDLLPPSILRRRKQGFSPPLATWFRGRLGRLARETLLDAGASLRGWTNPVEVERLLARAATGETEGTALQEIWSLLVLELWAKSHVGASAATEVRVAES